MGKSKRIKKATGLRAGAIEHPKKKARAKGFGEYLGDVFKSPEDKAELQAEIEYVQALADDAAAHPEKLGDVGELVKDDDELLDP